MNQANDLTTISFDVLSGVAGGGPNTDSRTTVGDGVILDRTYKSRTDSSYKLDAIQAACDRKTTTTEKSFWGDKQVADPAKAAQCFLDATK
jgi:hypothetical protein